LILFFQLRLRGTIIAIFNNIKESVGLDIGSSSIKVVELKEEKGRIELTRAELIEFPPALKSKKSGKKKRVGEALEKALGGMGTMKGKAVSMAIHGSSIYISYVKLPPVGTTRIAQIVNYEAQQQIPLPLEEVIWDYQVLKKKAMDINVVLVATKLELVKELLEEVAAFRIEPEVIDCSPLAFYNCFKFNRELSGEETAILLDMGAKSTEMSIERGGNLCWTRSISLGGNDLTQAIRKSSELSFAEAEKLKREQEIIGREDSGNEKKEFSPEIISVLSRLVNEVERSLTFYRAELGGRNIDRVLLGGGGARLANLDKFLERELGIEVKRVSPLKNIHLPNDFPFSGREDSFTVAIGLALRPLTKCASEISLLPLEIIKKKQFRKKKGDLTLSFVLALLIAVTVYAFAVQDYNLTRNRLSVIEDSLAGYKQYEQPVNVLKGEIKVINDKLTALRTITKGKDFWLRVLLEVSRLVPDEITLSNLSQEKGVLILEGEAPTIQVIRDFVSRLESSPLFGTVKVGTPDRITGKEEFYRFNLRVPLESFPFPKEKVNTVAPGRGMPYGANGRAFSPPGGMLPPGLPGR
jgi:type IV pilus assembly protein PilM